MSRFRFTAVVAGDTPFLDCAATIDNTRATLYLAAINRHKTHQINCEIELKNFDAAPHYEVHKFSSEQSGITSRFETLDGDTFSHTFPPHSITILKLTTDSAT